MGEQPHLGPPLEISCTINGRQQNIEQGDNIQVVSERNTKNTVKFVIVNKSNEVINFNTYKHGYRWRQVQVVTSDQFGVGKGRACSLRPSESCWLKVELSAQEYNCGAYLNLTMMFKKVGRIDEPPIRMTRKITFDCIPAGSVGRFDSLGPELQGNFDGDEEDEEYDYLKLIGLPDYESQSQLKYTLELKHYEIEGYVKQLVSSAQFTDKKMDLVREKLNIQSLDSGNYDEFFNSLLYLEEIQLLRDLRQFTMKSAVLQDSKNTDMEGNNRFELWAPCLAEKRPSILRGDRLCVIPLPPDEFKYEGKVDDTSRDKVYLIFHPQFEDDIGDVYGRKFKIEFTLERISLRTMHRAVEIVKSDNMEDILFPSEYRYDPFCDPETLTLDCFESRVEENPEQLRAIKHIVAGTSRPAPYLIYGPPGTGKTFTVVEAIKQVCKIYPDSKILVCAPQNDAADLIAERLLDHVNINSIMRFNAVTRSFESLSDKIQGISNFGRVRQRVRFPPKEDIERKQIVVSTLVTSGRLVSAGISKHFTHFFIDEAGHATEPETVIPLGLLSKGMRNGGQVVLAGDPQQLGAVIRSTLASQHGYGISLLERLMKLKNGLYSRGDTTPYNRNVVTKLLQNFRSHPQILEVPNQRFYQFKLQPCADVAERERFCGWEFLPKSPRLNWESDRRRGFPLIFHRVDGREEQDMSSPSWFNRHEVLVVLEYVEKLLLGGSSPKIHPKNIGIISPYIQQVRKIRKGLKTINSISPEYIDEIRVGSVEKFQGDEREVIIISTVRSQTDNLAKDKKFNLGFVSNRKRFNVAVTRAKSLLIIVGNPILLCTDENWRRMVEHIIKGGGYIGDPMDEDMLRIEEDKYTRAINGLSLDDMAGSENPSIYLQHNDDEMSRDY